MNITKDPSNSNYDVELQAKFDEIAPKKNALKNDKTVKFDIIEGTANAEAKYEKVLVEKFVKERPNKNCVRGDSTKVKVCNAYDDTSMTKMVTDYVTADAKYDKLHKQDLDFKIVKDAAADKIDKHTFSTFTTCDAKTGVIHKTFDGEDCKGTEIKFEAAWDTCTAAVGKGYENTWVKVTGAATLQAAAVAIVAFAGSQF